MMGIPILDKSLKFLEIYLPIPVHIHLLEDAFKVCLEQAQVFHLQAPEQLVLIYGPIPCNHEKVI